MPVRLRGREDRSCPKGYLWYTCSKGPYKGCCGSDPCSSGICDDPVSSAASDSTSSTETSTSLSSSSTETPDTSTTTLETLTTTTAESTTATPSTTTPTSLLTTTSATTPSSTPTDASPATVSSSPSNDDGGGVPILYPILGVLLGLILILSASLVFLYRWKKKHPDKDGFLGAGFRRKWGEAFSKSPPIVAGDRSNDQEHDTGDIKIGELSSESPFPAKPAVTSPRESDTSTLVGSPLLGFNSGSKSPMTRNSVMSQLDENSGLLPNEMLGSVPQHNRNSGILPNEMLGSVPEHRRNNSDAVELPDTSRTVPVELAAHPQRDLINSQSARRASAVPTLDQDRDSTITTGKGVILEANLGSRPNSYAPQPERRSPHVTSFMDYRPLQNNDLNEAAGPSHPSHPNSP